MSESRCTLGPHPGVTHPEPPNITGDPTPGSQSIPGPPPRTTEQRKSMAYHTLLLECMVVSSLLTISGSSPQSQFDDQFDPFDDSFYEPGPPYLGDIVKNVPRVGRRNDFFLKAAKSVPRIGRRDTSDDNVVLQQVSNNLPRVGRRNDFFLKAAKSVPRIGRRNDFFLKAAKSVPRIGRREDRLDKRGANLATAMEGGEMSAWPWFRNPELMPRPFKRGEPFHGQEQKESDHGLVFYKIDLHKEVEEPRLQAEV